ncbi:MAG: family 10 glycosylhydrolase [Tepidisphaeraceae bacterium]
MNRFLVIALFVVATAISIAHGAAPEMRGTWLTTTANDAVATPEQTAKTMRRLREIGLNTVYIECWKNGYTEWPSEVMRKLVGVPFRVNGADALQRDLLDEAVIEAHRNQMLAIAWLEYGLMVSAPDTEPDLRKFARQKGWLTLDQHGNEIGKLDHFVWLNPFHPECQQLLINLSVEAIRNYDLDGIQLDDRIALPADLGYDPYTVALYQKEHAGKSPPPVPDAFYAEGFKPSAEWTEWVQWRADRISEFAQRYVTAVRAVHPDLIISVSPAPHPWSLERYCCDWTEWSKWCYCGGRRWSEYVPQCYRMTGDETIKTLDNQAQHVGDERVNMVAGIRVVGDGPDLPFADLQRVIEHTRKLDMIGHCIWFSRGVLDVYPEQLKTFYDVAGKGPAQHPLKPGEWRPAPIVATKNAMNAWKATVSVEGRYNVIAKSSGTWSIVTTLDLKPGEQTFVQEADAVELLVDHRP